MFLYCSSSSYKFFVCSIVNSVNHEYKKWENEKTELFTCTSYSDLLIGSPSQEVDTDKEVVFSYDVLFEVA